MIQKYLLPRGFVDFYPEDMAGRHWLFGKMRQASKLFGYEEYDGPALEQVELYAAKSGEDLVKQQTFILNDRGGKKLALRPEMTPSLARMVAQKQEELTKPIRWFNIGPRWRYEKPQKGRTREFCQWDVDLLGIESPEADAEVIAVACEFFKLVGISAKEVVVRVSNRRLLEQKFNLIEIPPDKYSEVIRAIDKKDKMEINEWEKYLVSTGVNDLQIKDLKKILQDKDFAGESEELTTLFSTLTDLGYIDYVEFDPLVVRGLDYYTGTVFEACDRKQEFRAILGGGRYDNLVEIVGGKKLSGAGFACGDKVIEALLRKLNKWPEGKAANAKFLVTIFSESLYRDSLRTAQLLRSAGLPTELYLVLDDLPKQLKYANKKGIPYVIILGPDEAEKKTVMMKNMSTGEQTEITQEELLEKSKDL